MKARIVITFLFLVGYFLMFNLYLFELMRISHNHAALIYNFTTLIMLAFSLADWKFGFVNKYHERLNLICFLSIILNYILIIITHLNLSPDPVLMLILFNSGLFAIVIWFVLGSFKK